MVYLCSLVLGSTMADYNGFKTGPKIAIMACKIRSTIIYRTDTFVSVGQIVVI